MSFKDVVISSIGAGLAEIITLPICTIKTNYQTHLNYPSIFDLTKNIYHKQGIMGFYRSSFAAISTQIIATSTKFTFYNYIKKIRKSQDHNIKNNIINGCLGGICASVFSHPFDVIKIHQQNNIKFYQELKKVGVKLFYRGYSKCVTKSVMVTSLLFPFYDFYNNKLNNSLLASFSSSITATLIIHPIDYLKVRQVSNQQLYFSFSNISNIIKYYYRGLHINLFRVTPHFMITMYTINYLKKW